jgi:hypothetical protein
LEVRVKPEMNRQVKIIQLRNLLGVMNIPSFRRQDMSEANLRWLLRNIQINNAEHAGLPDALKIIKELLK